MATRCITITNEAYERLKAVKESKESFSDVITKITSKYTIFDLVGILSDEETEELRKNVKELRKRIREDVEKHTKRLK